jgi:hypothetical protein
MTEYVWELGIDWNAIEPEGVSYLRGGLVTGGVALPGTAPVRNGDTIIFRIFDASSSVEQKVSRIDSFAIRARAAVKKQQVDNPLSSLAPAIEAGPPPVPISVFGNVYSSWWCSAPGTVTVTASSGRFLLTVEVWAVGIDLVRRLFRHDPEMVVGPNT